MSAHLRRLVRLQIKCKPMDKCSSVKTPVDHITAKRARVIGIERTSDPSVTRYLAQPRSGVAGVRLRDLATDRFADRFENVHRLFR